MIIITKKLNRQYLFYIFFKNLYLNSISSFIPLICKKLFKTQPYFYISTNIQLFLFIHIVSCLGLVFNQEIGSLIDYYYSDTNSLYHAKEYADIILNDDNLKKEALHVDLPDDIQTAKFYKKITQIVLCCVALGLIYLNNNP